jgi:hypothetical protein
MESLNLAWSRTSLPWVSLIEILDELPRLTSEQRQQVAQKVLELEEGGEWLGGDDVLRVEEKHLVESRLAAHDRNPSSAVPWEEVKLQLRARFAR